MPDTVIYSVSTDFCRGDVTCNHILIECSATYRSFPHHQLLAGHAQPVFTAPFGNSGVHQNLAFCFIKVRKMAHPGDQIPRIFEHQPYCFCISGIL